jgi:shikimate dehydrogenase
MTRATPLIIASCPGRTIASVRQDVGRAAAAGADLGEVRVDRLSGSEQSRLEGLFPSPIPLVATLRSRSEGGEGPDALAASTPILEALARLPFQFLDLERVRDGPVMEKVASHLPRASTVIVSSHLPASTDTSEIRRLLELPRPSGAVAKVVLPCDFSRLWSDLLPALSPFDGYAPYVLHTTGVTGPILRAWAYRLGMFGVYGAVPRPTSSTESESVEPSQLPVDHLRTYLGGPSEGPLFAVVGHPVQHSRSPAIHAFWMKQEHRNGLYLALDMATAQDLTESLVPLSTGGFRGLNVTHPWKQVALSLASRAGPAAEAAGCANTLTFEPEATSAENTDVAAVRRRLSELRAAGRWDGSPVIVLGGGGAARAALAAVASLDSTSIVVTRRPEVAEGLAREYGGISGVGASLTPARLVIHATPAGREDSPALDFAWTSLIGPLTHVLDFVYEPVHGFLRTGVVAKGGTYEDGSRLLVYQAAESYAIWWGAVPSESLQEQVLREVLCAA